MSLSSKTGSVPLSCGGLYRLFRIQSKCRHAVRLGHIIYGRSRWCFWCKYLFSSFSSIVPEDKDLPKYKDESGNHYICPTSVVQPDWSSEHTAAVCPCAGLFSPCPNAAWKNHLPAERKTALHKMQSVTSSQSRPRTARHHVWPQSCPLQIWPSCLNPNIDSQRQTFIHRTWFRTAVHKATLATLQLLKPF